MLGRTFDGWGNSTDGQRALKTINESIIKIWLLWCESKNKEDVMIMVVTVNGECVSMMMVLNA